MPSLKIHPWLPSALGQSVACCTCDGRGLPAWLLPVAASAGEGSGAQPFLSQTGMQPSSTPSPMLGIGDPPTVAT